DLSYFYVFPRDVMVEAATELTAGSARIRITTNQIDLEKVRETGELYSGNEDPDYKGVAVDKNLKVTLYERYWDKKETGDYYDMISKKSYKTYEYFEVNNVLQNFDINTVNGAADYTLNIPGYTLNKSYYIICETTDSAGRPTQVTRYLCYYNNYWYGYGYSGDSSYYYLEFQKDAQKYKVDEPVNFVVKKNNSETVTGGAILYMVLQEGIKEYWVSTGDEQSKPFDSSYIPNVYIQAVYFDGKKLNTVYSREISYDPTEKELSIELKTDRESYKPGDTVDASVTVLDKEGRPCEATVNLSVVDEAYFALYGQYVDTLASLYQSVYSDGLRGDYISYREVRRGNGGAEGGEGEDEGSKSSARKNFVDNAYFDSVETDAHGKAKISFKVPDNLTSWRLTYQAVTDDLRAGSGKINIKTKIPFFIKFFNQDTYLEGDSPVLMFKGYGDKVKPGDQVSYTVTLKGDDGEQTFKEQGSAGSFVEIKLPELKEGAYTLTAQGELGDMKDAVEKFIQVKKSLLVAPQRDYYTLEEGLKIKDIGGYATISFYNASLRDYYQCLLDLYWSWGNRLDQVLAQNVARKLLAENFEGYSYMPADADISPYQKADGGFALLPYGASDVELSAKVAALCGQDANTSSLKSYFWSIINDPATTPLQISAAYWGLAALREPVLLDVESLLEQKDLTLDEKLYLANALADIGDSATAERILTDITSQYGKTLEPYKYIENGTDRDDIQRFTALTAMLAAKVDAEDKMAYAGYLENNSTDDILINLERLILVKQGMPYVSKASSFELQLDGKKELIKLDGVKAKTIMVSAEKLKTMKFSKIKGNVALSVSYEKEQDPVNSEDAIASIERSYNKNKSSAVEIGRSDTVKVDLKISFKDAAPKGYYEVTDVLPAGLRYIYPYQSEADEWYFGEPDGQRVKLGCYHAGGAGTVTISYLARVSAPGDYTAENAMVKHSESQSYGYSDRCKVQIR
ncbi:MAG: hypothetical protein N2376_11695, partial [Clostridia bacterium]|nr:hypothetical protein [Clostridia bacterium]